MRFYYILVVILSVFFPKPTFAQDNADDKTTGTLTITVINATSNGHSAVGDPVAVSIYQGEELRNTLQGIVDKESKAVFQAVPLGKDIFAVASCNHEDVMFQGRPVALEPSQTHLAAHVRVYDVSTDDSKLSIAIHHIVVRRDEESLLVSEYMRLKNSSDMAIKSDKLDSNNKSAVLRVILPQGYKNVQSISYFLTDALVFTDEGFYDTMSVAPGEYDIQFSYNLDIDSETMDFTKKFSLPTDDLILFIALPFAQATGLGPSNEFTMADGKASEYYSLGPQKPGEQLSFQLTGFKLPKQDRSWIIIAVVFGHIAMLVIWRLRKK